MSYTSILALIKAQLETVSGIGIVHDYFRYSDDLEKQAADLFVSNGIFHTWMITRTAVEAEAMTSFQVERTHPFELWGFYGMKDSEATEKTFQAICDLVLNKFDEDSNVVLSANADQPGAAQLTEFINGVEWMGVLTHRATIRINVFEEFDGGA